MSPPHRCHDILVGFIFFLLYQKRTVFLQMQDDCLALRMFQDIFDIVAVVGDLDRLAFELDGDRCAAAADRRILFVDLHHILMEDEIDGMVVHTAGDRADETDGFLKIVNIDCHECIMMGRDDAVVIRIFTVEKAGNEVRAAKGEGDMVFRSGDLDGAAIFIRQQADHIRKDAA